MSADIIWCLRFEPVREMAVWSEKLLQCFLYWFLLIKRNNVILYQKPKPKEKQRTEHSPNYQRKIKLYTLYYIILKLNEIECLRTLSTLNSMLYTLLSNFLCAVLSESGIHSVWFKTIHHYFKYHSCINEYI